MKRFRRLFERGATPSDYNGDNVKSPSKKELATPSFLTLQPELSCENDAVQVLEKTPSNEEPATHSSPPNSCNPATPVSRQERRRKEREGKKRERKSESVL
jgi:hypothetical protein